jgi:hypothetical protein
MLAVPIILLVVLLSVVYYAGARKKAGSISESQYQTLISVPALITTAAALAVLFLRLHSR